MTKYYCEYTQLLYELLLTITGQDNKKIKIMCGTSSACT